MHGATGFLESGAVLVCSAFVLVTICARIGIPNIVGYILTGVVVGPSGLGFVAESAALTTFGEIGVILLLFALGLEFSFEKLASLRRYVFGLGAAQVVVTTVLVSVTSTFLFGLAPVPAILIGGAVAMSSTALCLKVLASVNALGSLQGRMAIAVLLFQDLAAVAFLLLHDASSGASQGSGALTVLLGAAALVAVLFIARGPLQVIAKWIAARGDPELAQLLALAIALGSAIAAASTGLSPALAAFAAGMIIGEGDARHAVEKEIRPFRDLFVAIFFISIGTQLPVGIAASSWSAVLAWLGVLLLGKLMIFVAIASWFGEPFPAASRTGIILAHGGEFSLMLLSVSLVSGLVPEHFGAPLFLAIGGSMVCGALSVRWAGGSN